MSFAAWTMFVLFFAFSFLGMPIGHAMLASGIAYLLLTHQDIALVATQSPSTASMAASSSSRCRSSSLLPKS